MTNVELLNPIIFYDSHRILQPFFLLTINQFLHLSHSIFFNPKIRNLQSEIDKPLPRNEFPEDR
jgi:hypothetical protein